MWHADGTANDQAPSAGEGEPLARFTTSVPGRRDKPGPPAASLLRGGHTGERDGAGGVSLWRRRRRGPPPRREPPGEAGSAEGEAGPAAGRRAALPAPGKRRGPGWARGGGRRDARPRRSGGGGGGGRGKPWHRGAEGASHGPSARPGAPRCRPPRESRGEPAGDHLLAEGPRTRPPAWHRHTPRGGRGRPARPPRNAAARGGRLSRTSHPPTASRPGSVPRSRTPAPAAPHRVAQQGVGVGGLAQLAQLAVPVQQRRLLPAALAHLHGGRKQRGSPAGRSTAPPPRLPCLPAWPPCPPAAAGSRRAARSHGPQSSLAAGPGAEAASPPPPPPGVCGHRGGRLTPASCAPRPRRPAPPPPPKTANRGRGARPAVGPRPNRRSAPARLQLWNVGGGYPVASRREGSGETSPSPPCPARPIERRGRRERRASQPTRQRQDCSRRAPPRPRGVERVRAGGGCVRRGVLRAAAAGRGSAGGAAAPAGPDSCPPRSRRAPRGLPGAVRALPLLQRFVWVRRRRTASRHGHASGLRPPEGLPARGSERRRRWKAGEAGLPPVTGGECRAKRPGQPLTPTRRCRCGAQVNFSGVTVAVTGQLGFWFS